MSCFALLHGGGGSGWSWRLVEAELRALGHDSVAPDLPITDPAAGYAAYVDVVLDALGDADDVVVVGHSLGGLTAPLVADALGSRARAVVLLAGMPPKPGESASAWWEATGFTNPPGEWDDVGWFLHDVPPALAADELGRTREERSAMFGEPWPLDALPDVPTHALVCADDRFFTPEFLVPVSRERLGVEPRLVPGSHGAMLSRPREITRALHEIASA